MLLGTSSALYSVRLCTGRVCATEERIARLEMILDIAIQVESRQDAFSSDQISSLCCRSDYLVTEFY